MSNVLVGKTIKEFKIAKNREALLFVVEEGGIVVPVEADCCSFPWIEHIELPALGFPAEVLSVESLDLPGSKDNSEGWAECLQVYGCKITTNRGVIIIDYRNESNGYYGGSLVWPYNDNDSNIYDQTIRGNEWVDIKV